MAASSNGRVVALLENADHKKNPPSYAVKVGLAQMLRGGTILAVRNAREAQIAEESGAVAVVAVEGVNAAAAAGGVLRMMDPGVIREIKKAVSIPVIAQCRLGHFMEAQVLEAVGVDFIDECEALTPADDQHFINKHNLRSPFICGVEKLGEALCRVAEGAAMVRTAGGSAAHHGDPVAAVRHARAILREVRSIQTISEDELYAYAKRISAPFELVKLTRQLGRLPVVHFASGGIATPADAAMLMQIGCDGVFIGWETIFCSTDPAATARAFVQAVANYNDSQLLARVCSSYQAEIGRAVAAVNLNAA